jgi:aminoglycoside 2''-phosphotransferase
MSGAAEYARRIENAFPELRPVRVRRLGSGQYNDVVLVNGNLVFRFPRHRRAIEDAAREYRLLQWIAPRVSLAVPRPAYMKLEPLIAGEAFFGYPVIRGRPLTRRLMARRPAFRDQAAEQLGAFLNELHGLSIPAEMRSDLPVLDDRAYWEALFRRVEESLFPLMSPEGRKRASAEFAGLELRDRDDALPGRFRHGDFGAGNILADPATGSVTGVIDFSNVGVGDPAVDIGGLLSSYGDGFVQRLTAGYPEAASMLRRAHSYRRTFALQEALAGSEAGDPDAVERGLRDYR